MDALEYNRSRGFNPDIVARIQRTVAATPDGIWGPRTIAKVIAWQTLRGRSPCDGTVDDATMQAFEAEWANDATPTGDEAIDDIDAPQIDAEPTTLELSDDGYLRLDDLKNDVAAAIEAVQNDLFAFGFEPGRPDGRSGPKTRAALRAFQQAARQSARIVGDARTSVAVTYTRPVTGTWDAATVAELARWKAKGYRYREIGAEYAERRVRVADYARMPRSSVNLVDVPSTQDEPRRLHRLAAAALDRLLTAANVKGFDLRVQSGWRAHRWQSREQYEQVLVQRYGSVIRGRNYLAFDSPHETGLAVDWGTCGMYPVTSTIPQQRQAPAWKWLCENAWRYGWHPYKNEPWHWEFPLSLRAWTTGESDWGG